MEHYKTVEEKAMEWNITARHIQYLCRTGKIDGIIKRAGSWFIPNDIPSPLKNNKSNSKKFSFIGTKKKVFDHAIELFAKNGAENVSLKDIADAVEITQSTIYNHFSSKKDLLDTIYDYYIENFNDNLNPIEDMKSIMKGMSKEELCLALMFTFEPPDSEKYKRMILITKIIYMRLYQDDRAKVIFLSLMNADMEEYVKNILQHGVTIGIIEPFDIATYAKFIVGQRHIMGMKAFANPAYEPQQLEEEQGIIRMCANLLPFVSEKQK